MYIVAACGRRLGYAIRTSRINPVEALRYE